FGFTLQRAKQDSSRQFGERSFVFFNNSSGSIRKIRIKAVRGPAQRPLRYPHLRSCFEIGSDRILLPVAAKIALHNAGGAGGSAGSPNPVGGKSVFRKYTSIDGGA